MAELIGRQLEQVVIDANIGMHKPAQFQPADSITVALYGTVHGPDWREEFKDLPIYDTPVVYYDPRDTYQEGPEHYVPELQHFYDDIRVNIVGSHSYGFNSLFELGHLVAVKLDIAPLVVYIAPVMQPDIGEKSQRKLSAEWRNRLLESLDVHQHNSNLHIAASIDEARFMTHALIAQRSAAKS